MVQTWNTSHVTYPVVVIEVDGMKCKALIDIINQSSKK